MGQIRGRAGQPCHGWAAGPVREIVASHLDELIVPYVHDERGRGPGLIAAAGEDVIIASTGGQEIPGPAGTLLGAALVIATRWDRGGCRPGMRHGGPIKMTNRSRPGLGPPADPPYKGGRDVLARRPGTHATEGPR